MSEIVWEDPPGRRIRDSIAVDVGRIMAAYSQGNRPGEWARVFVGGASGADSRAKILKERGFEAATSQVDGGRALYVRKLA